MVYEPELENMLAGCPVPAYRAVDLRNVDVDASALPPMFVPTSGSDIAMIFHTSGSTSSLSPEGMTMWVVQIPDPEEAQEWIGVIKSAVLNQR